MGKHYDGKRRWNETIQQATPDLAVAGGANGARTQPKKKRSGRTVKLSRAMAYVDEETRAMVLNQRLEALEADHYGYDQEDNEENDDDDMYVDDEVDSTAPVNSKEKKAKKTKMALPIGKRVFKVKSLAQHVFEELGAEAEASETPNYLRAAASSSVYPARRFCVICGNFGKYSCKRCGSAYCRVKCGDQHQETGCLKFGT